MHIISILCWVFYYEILTNFNRLGIEATRRNYHRRWFCENYFMKLTLANGAIKCNREHKESWRYIRADMNVPQQVDQNLTQDVIPASDSLAQNQWKSTKTHYSDSSVSLHRVIQNEWVSKKDNTGQGLSLITDGKVTNLAYTSTDKSTHWTIAWRKQANQVKTTITRKRLTSLFDCLSVIKVNQRESMDIVYPAIQAKNRYSIFALLLNKVPQNLAINTNIPAKKSQMPNIH